MELDLTKSDFLTVEYTMENLKSLTGLTFNENEKDLFCQTIEWKVKRCTVPKSHFEGKKSDYYFLMHNNYLDGKSTSYEGIPVKVILYDSPGPADKPIDQLIDKHIDHSNGNLISFTLVYSLFLLLIMV